MIIAILGRQPKLGLAELEQVYGATKVQPVGDHAALIEAPNVDGMRLGGTMKLAKPLTPLPFTDWRKLTAYCIEQLPHHLGYLPEGKLKLGLSVYGLNVTTQDIFRAGLELKKVCRANKRSVRIVPPSAKVLNSAQVLHNQMTEPLGMELLFIKDGAQTWLAQTTWVQDVDDYARRDYGRPRRDAKVGMLPPKLALSMLNLAGAKPAEVILDPFCGTGVVLQEAALIGCQLYGSDIEERMIRFTRDNINWLQEIYHRNVGRLYEVADATTATWRPPIDHVVCETYLGQPLSGLPAPLKLSEIMNDCNTILSKFLKNLRPQLAVGTTHCLALPAWRIGQEFRHLPLLDHLEEMGYNRTRFKHASWDDLVYHREGQIVARELAVLTVK
jgi:hypothetical protein